MRRALPLLVATGLLGGCAGHVADYIGSRASIVKPQLIRYGLDLNQAGCVGEKLGADLTPLQLRLFARSAGAHQPSSADRLNARDLLRVATAMRDAEIGRQLQAANGACGVLTEPPALHPTETGAGATAATTAPVQTMPPAGTWLNLGAAGTGQSIAVDASSIEESASMRSAWFRLTEPGAPAPGHNRYLLRIDCGARTIAEKARRKPDGTGATVEVPGDDKPIPIESGTVMEIAWLALCT